MRFVLALVLSSYAGGAFAQCALIQDNDKRWFCRAQTEKSSSPCRSIQDQTLRRLCLAETQNNVDECNSIIDQQKRAYCRARVGGR